MFKKGGFKMKKSVYFFLKGESEVEKNKNTGRYVFENADGLVRYLYSVFGNLTPIKLQKGLYFLYAYYGAIYNQDESDGVLEESFGLPNELFPPRFEAWTYGPVIREVWKKHKNGEYDSYSDESPEGLISEKYNEVGLFIRELFAQINKVSDFSLVDRSHEDKSWKEPFEEHGNSASIDHQFIIREYKEKYV